MLVARKSTKHIAHQPPLFTATHYYWGTLLLQTRPKAMWIHISLCAGG